MIRHIVKPLSMAVVVVALVSSLAQAAPDEMKTPPPLRYHPHPCQER
jgi:hypothetical protein